MLVFELGYRPATEVVHLRLTGEALAAEHAGSRGRGQRNELGHPRYDSAEEKQRALGSMRSASAQGVMHWPVALQTVGKAQAGLHGMTGVPQAGLLPPQLR